MSKHYGKIKKNWESNGIKVISENQLDDNISSNHSVNERIRSC